MSLGAIREDEDEAREVLLSVRARVADERGGKSEPCSVSSSPESMTGSGPGEEVAESGSKWTCRVSKRVDAGRDENGIAGKGWVAGVLASRAEPTYGGVGSGLGTRGGDGRPTKGGEAVVRFSLFGNVVAA